MQKQFFKDSLIYGISSILSRGISLFLLPFYSRVFSPTDYGIIDILNIVNQLAILTVVLEISQGFARYYSDAETNKDKIAYSSTALWFTVAVYGVFTVVVLSFSKDLSIWILGASSKEYIFKIAVFAIVGNGIFYQIQNQMRWQLLTKEYAFTNVIFTLFSLSLTIIFILFLKSGINGVFYGNLCAYMMSISLGYYFCRDSYKLIFEWDKCKEMLRFSIPLLFSSISVFIALYIDRFAIKELMTLGDVGFYGIAYRFASIVGLFFSGFQNALTPLVYKKYREPTTPEEIASIFRYFMALMLITIVVLVVFSPEIILIFTTPQYYPAAPVIPIIAAAIIFSNMYIFAPGLAIAKKTKIIALINIIAAVINTVLNFLLIPILGLSGAGLATLSSAFIAFIIYMISSQKHYFIPYLWMKTGIASLLVLFLYFLLLMTNNLIFTNITISIVIKILIFLIFTVFIADFLIGKQKLFELFQILVQKLKT